MKMNRHSYLATVALVFGISRNLMVPYHECGNDRELQRYVYPRTCIY